MEQYSNTEASLLDNHVDDHVDVEIQECLSSDPPKSFSCSPVRVLVRLAV